MRLLIIVVAVLAGCSDQQNLGDRAVLHDARWAITATASTGMTSADLLAIDGAGDAVAVGGFVGTVNFGTSTLTAPADGATWVSKRSGIDGSELWTFALSGTDFGVSGVALTPQGDIVLVGSYVGTLVISGHTLRAQQNDVFVAKYDAGGQLTWVTGLDPSSQANATSVAIGEDGQIYVSAAFTGTISLPDRIISGGPYVVAALSPDGQIVWGRQQPVGGKVHVTSDGHVIVAGVVAASTMFGGTSLDLTQDPDLFVASLDHAGTLERVSSFGKFGTPDRDLTSTLDADNDLVAVANGQNALTSAPREMLVNDAGTAIWSASVANGAAFAYAIAVADNSVISAGRITSESFDPGNGVRVGAMYLMARDGNGALLDARVFGDPSLGGDDVITALAVGPNGQVGFAGHMNDRIDFGSGQLTPPTIGHDSSFVIGVLAN